MQKGDLVLVSFPFTNFKGKKRRPAVLLLAGELDAIVCFITSKMDVPSNNDIVLEPQTIHGLKKTSSIRVDKIVTLDRDLISGKIGKLTEDEISKLNNKLRNIFDL